MKTIELQKPPVGIVDGHELVVWDHVVASIIGVLKPHIPSRFIDEIWRYSPNGKGGWTRNNAPSLTRLKQANSDRRSGFRRYQYGPQFGDSPMENAEYVRYLETVQSVAQRVARCTAWDGSRNNWTCYRMDELRSQRDFWSDVFQDWGSWYRVPWNELEPALKEAAASIKAKKKGRGRPSLYEWVNNGACEIVTRSILKSQPEITQHPLADKVAEHFRDSGEYPNDFPLLNMATPSGNDIERKRQENLVRNTAVFRKVWGEL